MPNYTQSFERNKPSPKFTGVEEYNPEITVYYESDGNVVRVEESWRGNILARTISGSNYAQNWPDYDKYEIISAWTTISG